MLLRQMSDGHVVTVQSAEGHMITLSVQNGRAVLSLSEALGGNNMTMNGAGGGVINGSVLEEGVFTPTVSNSVVRGYRVFSR